MIREYTRGFSCLFSTKQMTVSPAKRVDVDEEIKERVLQVLTPAEPVTVRLPDHPIEDLENVKQALVLCIWQQ